MRSLESRWAEDKLLQVLLRCRDEEKPGLAPPNTATVSILSLCFSLSLSLPLSARVYTMHIFHEEFTF